MSDDGQVLLEIFRNEIRWYHFRDPFAVNVVTDRIRTAAVKRLAAAGKVDIGTAEPGSYSVPSLTDDDGACNCESYNCSGECCGVGNCTCTPVDRPGSTSPEPGPAKAGTDE